MAKLMELWGRKGELDPINAAPSASTKSGKDDGEPADIFSDAGSRLGEENEALRNLLSDTGRKIGELDELKQTFDKLVTPFYATLRALEQEKSRTLSLSGMLEESRAAFETLRTEFYEIEKKATDSAVEVESLREQLEFAREASRTLEGTRIELSDEIKARHVQIAELEHRLAQESSQHRNLSEAHRSLQERIDGAEKCIIELESELAATREKLALIEDDKGSLQHAVDQGLNEAARLSRRLTESENMLTATRAQLGKVEASFAEVFAERGRLAAALDEIREQHQAEHNSLNMRLDAVASRASTAERLLADARQNLIARTEEVRAFDRKSVESTIARDSAERRLAQLEVAHEKQVRQIKDLEQARTMLTERGNALAKALKIRETALARADEKIASLTERNARLEADVQISHSNIDKRVEELNATLQSECMEHAVVEGALEATRKDNIRLQDEIAMLRSALRRGLSLDELSMAPSEPANEDAAPDDKVPKGA